MIKDKLIRREHLNDPTYTPCKEFMKKRDLQILKIKWIDELEEIMEINKEIQNKVYLPFYRTPQNSITSKAPKVSVYRFRNVYGNTNGSNFHNNQEIFIERLPNVPTNECNYRAGNLIVHGEATALVHKPKNITIITESCFFLSGYGPENYYHLLIEIISKLLLISNKFIQTNKIKTLVVSSAIYKTAQFKEILESLLCLTKINLKVKSYDQDKTLFFNEVFHINSHTQYLIHSPENFFKASHFIYSMSELKKLREKLLELKKKPAIDPPKKILLLRNPKYLAHYNQRHYNEQEVSEYLEKIGYKGIYIEEYSFQEQIYIFNKAKSICGPTGAFWANIIFCNSNCLAISWLNENQKNFSCYSTLAKISSCNMLFINSIENDPTNPHGSYTLPINNIKDLIDSIKTTQDNEQRNYK